MTTLRMRVWEHVDREYARKRVDDYRGPEALTQDGIAEVLGKTRGHIASITRQLEREGKIRGVLRHVDGSNSRRRVYVPAGAEVISEYDTPPTTTKSLEVYLMRVESKLDELIGMMRQIH